MYNTSKYTVYSNKYTQNNRKKFIYKNKVIYKKELKVYL